LRHIRIAHPRRQLKETKTTKAGADCPTLLHYLARVLLRTNPSLVTFMEDLPHVEAAARGAWLCLAIRSILHSETVSLQTVATSVHALVTGLAQVENEVEQYKTMNLTSDDHFIKVMEVCDMPRTWLNVHVSHPAFLEPSQPRRSGA
jgi:diaphanous 1